MQNLEQFLFLCMYAKIMYKIVSLERKRIMKGFKRFDDLFWKYMLAYKKRTVFTILGITMSVVLFFGTGTIYTSVNHAIYETNKLQYGDFDAKGYVTAEECQRLRKLDYIDEMLLTDETGQSYVLLEEDDSQINLILRYLETFDQTIYSYELLEGRYPENDHELLLEQYQADYFGVRIGEILPVSTTTYWYEGTLIGDSSDAVEFIYSHQERDEDGNITEDSITRDDLETQVQTESYQVVGIYTDKGSDMVMTFFLDQMTVLSLMNRENHYTNLNVCVRFQNHKDHQRELQEEEGIFLEANSIHETDPLLEYILFVIAFAILFWISVLIIRNVFVMTMAERSRDYGILRCMGISQYRLYGLLRKEGFAMAAISCVLGMSITVLGIEFGKNFGGFRLLLKMLGIFELFHVHISLWMVAGSIGFTFCAVLFSLLEPARQIGAIAPIDAVIGRAAIKKERFKRRKGTLIRWIFGVEGEYAYKNLLRNKGKFVASMVGIVISVIGLMISFDLVHIMESAFSDDEPGRIFDASASFMNDRKKTEADVQQLEADLLALESVEAVRSFYAMDMPTDGKRYGLLTNRSGEKPDYTYYYANGWEEEQIAELEPYLLEGSLDYTALQDNGVIVCRHNLKYTYLVDEWVESKPQKTDLQVGDMIWIPKDAENITSYYFVNVFQDDGTLDMSKMMACRVTAVVDYNPYPVSNPASGHAEVIFAKEFYQEHLVPSYRGAGGLDYVGVLCSEHYDVEEIYEFQKQHKGYYFTDDGIHELKETIKGYQQLILLVAVIIIGIGALNIFNTLSSNIVLRKQEFQIMSAIGMSRKQILKMLSLEGGLAAILGSFIGIILGGFIGYWLTMFGREIAPSVQYQVPWAGIILAVALAAGITGISLLIAQKDLVTWEE